MLACRGSVVNLYFWRKWSVWRRMGRFQRLWTWLWLNRRRLVFPNVFSVLIWFHSSCFNWCRMGSVRSPCRCSVRQQRHRFVVLAQGTSVEKRGWELREGRTNEASYADFYGFYGPDERNVGICFDSAGWDWYYSVSAVPIDCSWTTGCFWWIKRAAAWPVNPSVQKINIYI